MTIDFFAKYYNLEEFKVNKAIIKNKHLYLDMTTQVKLELIANGYRPEMDVEQEKTYVFNVNYVDYEFSNVEKISVLNDKENYYLLLDDTKLLIINNEIRIL